MRGGHSHQRLIGGRAKGAQHYPPALCLSIVNAFRRQLQADAKSLGAFIDGMTLMMARSSLIVLTLSVVVGVLMVLVALKVVVIVDQMNSLTW